MYERIALLLEVVGFFTTAVLVAIIKWEVIRPTSDRVKAIIVETPSRLAKPRTLLHLLALIFAVRVIVRYALTNKKDRKKLSFRLRGIWDFVLYWTLWVPSILFSIPLYVLGYAAKLLSGHNVITNLLLFLGTAAILAGLIIEVIINW